MPRRLVDDPEFRRERARLGAHEMHAKHDVMRTTSKARANSPSNLAYWRKKVDPDGKLPWKERQRRAEHAKKAYYQRLALAGVKARRAKKR